MKKILIIGEKSYLSIKFREHIKEKKDLLKYEVISVRNNSWEKMNFSNFDSVLFFAGIAHVKETEKNQHLYYKVNYELAYNIAQKSLNEGVNQFIYLSSMSVYGKNIDKITSETIENPNSEYGKSKLKAEKEISKLENKGFKVAIIRPPMVYGNKGVGNYQKLSKANKFLRLFPSVKNKRSMIYVENLSEFLMQVILKGKSGIMYPQNIEYVCTTELYQTISECHNRKNLFFPVNRKILDLININILNKLFGDLYYEEKISKYDFEYNIVSFEQSIQKSEGEINE